MIKGSWKLTIVLIAAGLVASVCTANAADTIKIGFIAPLSGPWARQGQLMKMGAELAIADVNAKGGVAALDGAKLELVVADAGDSTEKAKNAAQRLLAEYPNMVAGMGAWLSSFTLAVTEVTERARLPWLTFSFADQITDRGFRYVFQDGATGSLLADLAVPTLLNLAATTGKKPATTAILADNTAAAAGFVKALRSGSLEKVGVKVVTDETFTPPLSDATPLILPLRRSQPDFLVMLPTNISDAKLMLEKLKEFGLRTPKMPIISFGAHMGTPELKKATGPDLLEGLMALVVNWSGKGSEDLIKRFVATTGEPWMTQDSIGAYGEIWIIKEALEKAKIADREKLGEALRTMDLNDGIAKLFPGGRVKFDEKGRRVSAGVVIVQWQKGVPVVVWPQEMASASAYWPKQ